jgi:hypothetical protein
VPKCRNLAVSAKWWHGAKMSQFGCQCQVVARCQNVAIWLSVPSGGTVLQKHSSVTWNYFVIFTKKHLSCRHKRVWQSYSSQSCNNVFRHTIHRVCFSVLPCHTLSLQSYTQKCFSFRHKTQWKLFVFHVLHIMHMISLVFTLIYKTISGTSEETQNQCRCRDMKEIRRKCL